MNDKKYILILAEKRVETDDVEFAREFLGMRGRATVTVDLRAEPAVQSTPTASATKKEKPKEKLTAKTFPPNMTAASDVHSHFEIKQNENRGYTLKSGNTTTSVSAEAISLTEKSVQAAFEKTLKPVSPKEIQIAMENSFRKKLTSATISLALIVLRESHRVKPYKLGKARWLYVPNRAESKAEGEKISVVPQEEARRETEVNKSVKDEKNSMLRSLDKPT